MATPLPVYIIHWNAPEWLEACVRSVLDSRIPLEVVVVDNGPAGAAPSLPSPVRALEMSRNRGYSGAANAAIAEWLGGDAPYCVVASHDLEAGPAVFERLVQAADAHPSFGLIGPELSRNFLSKPLAEEGMLDVRRMVSGGCMLLRRACIEEVGGFDESFGSYGEDEDLCERAREAGWGVGTVRGLSLETMGTHDPARRSVLATAAVTLLLYKQRGWRGAVRGTASGLRKAVRQLRRRQLRESTRLLQGTVVGIWRAVRYRRGTSSRRAR